MRSSMQAALTALTTATLLAAPLSSATERGRGLEIVGLADGTSLVSLQSENTRTRGAQKITGLAGDATLVGIDHRVQDGLLYGLGNAGGIYTIDARGAKATKIGNLTVPLQGTTFGVDFNPAANALRVVSDTGQNLRQPFATTPLVATVVDTPLTNPAVAPATGTVPALGVTGAAYTNNDLDAGTGATLFVLDTTADRVSIQSPANAGTLAPTGILGVAAGPNAGFDIYSTVRQGRTTDVAAFASLEVSGRYSLYRINLLTGSADRVGGLDGVVSDIAIPLNQR